MFIKPSKSREWWFAKLWCFSVWWNATTTSVWLQALKRCLDCFHHKELCRIKKKRHLHIHHVFFSQQKADRYTFFSESRNGSSQIGCVFLLLFTFHHGKSPSKHTLGIFLFFSKHQKKHILEKQEPNTQKKNRHLQPTKQHREQVTLDQESCHRLISLWSN